MKKKRSGRKLYLIILAGLRVYRPCKPHLARLLPIMLRNERVQECFGCEGVPCRGIGARRMLRPSTPPSVATVQSVQPREYGHQARCARQRWYTTEEVRNASLTSMLKLRILQKFWKCEDFSTISRIFGAIPRNFHQNRFKIR